MDPIITTKVTPYRVEADAVTALDQRALPTHTVFWTLRNAPDVAEAIRTLAVRGAPLLGAMAAYGLWLGALRAKDKPLGAFNAAVETAHAVIRGSRPTAVNLFVGLQAGMDAFKAAPPDVTARIQALKQAADALAAHDRDACHAMGLKGAALLPSQGGVLTHCNAGALATCGIGTALGVIRAAWATGKQLPVFADETRPLLQGARLTAWELMQDGIPVTLLPDGAAASLLRSGKVSAVVVGSDRIAANGDVANKVGTYGVALAAREHGIPFYVAAPSTTVDLKTADGASIVIEQRASLEVTSLQGVDTAPTGVHVFNPAFDVTPARLVTAIITERGVANPVTPSSLAALMA
jgi:methylthioribose-1-phosphate isomerase